ncbi:hypothetical protein [Flavobacterium sp. UMI-01]|uniref:hypothetical protein n=1 Tax=Flavobacterium sp. UMI-01 TaxID=1441053 RepID=UPI001C7D979C|nr:hypothetical protein [Flavobacterium sp. UMI-01]GIZ08479.1 hypothetical protein FUMI01_12060 [Flavobacterium sp. UMI-01]
MSLNSKILEIQQGIDFIAQANQPNQITNIIVSDLLQQIFDLNKPNYEEIIIAFRQGANDTVIVEEFKKPNDLTFTFEKVFTGIVKITCNQPIFGLRHPIVIQNTDTDPPTYIRYTNENSYSIFVICKKIDDHTENDGLTNCTIQMKRFLT